MDGVAISIRQKFPLLSRADNLSRRKIYDQADATLAVARRKYGSSKVDHTWGYLLSERVIERVMIRDFAEANVLAAQLVQTIGKQRAHNLLARRLAGSHERISVAYASHPNPLQYIYKVSCRLGSGPVTSAVFQRKFKGRIVIPARMQASMVSGRDRMNARGRRMTTALAG